MSKPVKFDNPPVVEVVCGVMFANSTVQAVHIGAFWNLIRAEFPKVEEAPPLSAIVEVQDQAVAEFEWSTLPPHRRVWLYNIDGSNLIQIQPDRFLFNWKHTVGTKNYPSFASVYAEFEKRLRAFMSFMNEVAGIQLTVRQLEMTYVNHIGQENGLQVLGEAPLLVDHVHKPGPRFLPMPENINFTTSYRLPGESGRLHVVAQSSSSSTMSERLIRLDLVARGMGPDASEKSRREWFELAHEWITHGFADVTSSVIQAQVWKRTS